MVSLVVRRLVHQLQIARGGRRYAAKPPALSRGHSIRSRKSGEELKRYPKEEAEELALIYAAPGIPIAEARDVAAHLIANPDQALDTRPARSLG
jgi:hypothetical protein